MHQKNILKAKQCSLNELVSIKAGYPFRGSLKEILGGGAHVVQPRDISDLGELMTDSVIETKLTGKKNAHWLSKDDVLFISKGLRTKSCYIDQNLSNFTCSPSLFILQAKPNWKDRLNMNFVAWQLNQAPAQNYFRRTAEGSNQINIRKQTLANLIIGVPDLEKQNIIAKLYRDTITEHKVLLRLIENRKLENNLIAANLLCKQTQ